MVFPDPTGLLQALQLDKARRDLCKYYDGKRCRKGKRIEKAPICLACEEFKRKEG